jgi:predicted DsbA family dithiol-disulfide isomerase
VHTQFPLHPDTPQEGLLLVDLFRGRAMNLEAAHARLNALLDAEGLPHGPRDRTYNSRLAQELGKWGDSKDAPELHDALYRAYFVEARNIGDPEVLVRVAASVGLPADEARRALEERSFREAVDRDWARARQLGVTGVPTYVMDGEGVVGAQPYETLEELVVSLGAKRR